MEGGIVLTASGPQGVGKTLLLNAIADFLSTDEVNAPESLTLFRKVYTDVVVLNETVSK